MEKLKLPWAGNRKADYIKNKNKLKLFFNL